MTNRDELMIVFVLLAAAVLVGIAVLMASLRICLWLAEIARAIQHIDVRHEVYVDGRDEDDESDAWKRGSGHADR